ncbi:MAG: S8 family serine peptidase [Ruminococcus sp.]|nr:S8 family serine peptidase [Ruminococcus sp.]
MKYQKLSCAVTSMVLAIVLMVLSVCAPIGALETVSTTNEDKIDSALKEKMATASPDEKIPVAIWYADVDQDNIDKLTAEKVGFTQDDVAVAYEMPSTELLASLEAEEAGATDEMQSYLKRTERQREQERKRTDEYIMTRREFSREKYNAKSADIIKDIKINDEDITFKSQYAPMIIAEITKSEISKLKTVEDIISVAYYKEPEVGVCTEITADNIKNYLKYDDVVQKFTLTGKGVNIGLFEKGGYPVAGCSELSYNKIHPIGNAREESHVTNTARILVGAENGFAPDAELYCSDSDKEDVESLISVGISVLNVSFGWVYKNNITDDRFAYSTEDKWIDHIVSHHSVTVIASAGNYPEETDNRVFSPAMGHNVIAVGAFSDKNTADLNDDLLWVDSRYVNTNGTEVTTGIEKPDVIMSHSILGGGTSSSAPVLTGLVALLVQLKPSLALYSQAVKAIVLASCHRKVLPAIENETAESIYQGITEKQGAGAPDFYTMVSIVCNGTYGVGRIKGTRTQAVRRFVMPTYGASNMNVSLTWLRESTFVDDEGNILTDPDHSTDILQADTSVNLNLSVYSNNTEVGCSALANSSTEMAYFEINNTDINYEIRINKATTLYTGTVRYGYAYSTDKPYLPPVTEELTPENYITDEGIYYIRNYYTDKYLTLDTTTGETTMQDFATTAEGRQNQMWVLKGTQDDYELLPAYGSVGQKLNFGAQVGTNPYYKSVVGTSDLNLTVKSWEIDTSLEPDAYVFTSTSGGSNNIMSYTYSTGVFVRTETDSVVNMYRMWVLEDINYLLGDVTMDGSLDDNDMEFIQRYTVGQETLNNTKYYLADFNKDGTVNIKDSTEIQQYVDVLEEE